MCSLNAINILNELLTRSFKGLTNQQMMSMNQFEMNQNGLLYTAWKIVDHLLAMPETVTEAVYSHAEVQHLMANDRYDLVMTSSLVSVASYPLAWHFRAPIVINCFNALFPGLAPLLGGDDRPEYMPLRPAKSPAGFTLIDRLVNTMAMHFTDLLLNKLPVSTVRAVTDRYLPDCPPFDQLEEDISLVLTNSHVIFNGPRVYPPQVVEVAAMHCRPAQPLPVVITVSFFLFSFKFQWKFVLNLLNC